eukprot:CAMPEP_0195538460 /NCGR_PEP_ID=MMETSP0794_2-20130614/49539_1 /TAXON_ID=515487 /ORGANISM="Stephanopyxis turris, Strain CCMP 815" /LENGTH=561 /DNA_ID=CAMNT_0040672441 /DNA_START=113 /DNA_END=1798 /DNA_ORIENTATION=+
MKHVLLFLTTASAIHYAEEDLQSKSTCSTSPSLWVPLLVEKMKKYAFFPSLLKYLELLNHWFVLSIAILFFTSVWLKIRPLQVPKSVPGPPRLPLFGILKHMLDRWETWPDEVVRLCNLYDRTWGGPVPNLGGLTGAVFFLVDEECVKHVLYDKFELYEKGDVFRNWLSDLLGNGIFAADGELWKVHRKMASHFFSRNMLRHSANITKQKLDQVVEKLNERIDENGGSVNIDMQDMFYRMTIDIIASMAFGMELNSILREGTQHPFALAFDEVQALTHARIIDPFFRFKRFLSLTANERRIRQSLNIMSDFTNHVIQNKRRTAQGSGTLGPDLISRYLSIAKENQEVLPTAKDLHHIVMNFIIAGRDTTACALSWILYELTKHPQIVDKMLEEINHVCGTGEDVDFSFQTMSRLSYVHAVVMEGLRLHPSVYGDCKYSTQDDVLPDGTFIPKGSMVNYYPLYFGRSERLWGEDAMEFRPERFFGVKEPSPYLYNAFNAGYRICLGKPLAILEMKITLSCLLPKFNFVDVEKHSGAYKFNLVRSMKDGFPVEVSRKMVQMSL